MASLLSLLPRFTSKHIVLGSKSPRRKEILERALLGVDLEIIGSSFEEDLDKAHFQTPAEYVIETSRHKIINIMEKEIAQGNDLPDLLIGSDTVVVLDGTLLEKPQDEEDAVRMLNLLSGRIHQVVSGVVLCYKVNDIDSPGVLWGSHSMHSFSACTNVEFDHLSEDTIRAYVETKEPMDKAGSYGIQGIGGQLIKGIEGCYFNVMGFPLNLFSNEICKLILHPDSLGLPRSIF